MNSKELYQWCQIPYQNLPKYPMAKTPYRIVKDKSEMGELMASELIKEIQHAIDNDGIARIIVPCGPRCWYEPFARMINQKKISLKNVVVYHMDECLDWQGCLLPKNHPYNFQTFMEKEFYAPIDSSLATLEINRKWLTPQTMEAIRSEINENTIHYALGGWGQDGHLAYNQTRRHPFSTINLEQLASCSIRIQENNLDTIIALAQRELGAAYQFAPAMSVTLGLKEILKAKKIRVYSDTGSWKQTAFRVALFSEPTVEYPITLLQNHSDAIITATIETASHTISLNPQWEFFNE